MGIWVQPIVARDKSVSMVRAANPCHSLERSPMSNFQHESEFNSPALNELIREGLFDLPPADEVLYYCPQCSVVFLKFPNTVISPSTEPRRTLAETFGYLWCERCSGDFQDEKVML